MSDWDPRKHPRKPKGSPEGGQFSPADEALAEFKSLTIAHPFARGLRITPGNRAMVDLKRWGSGLSLDAVASLERGTGAGRDALKMVTDIADKHGVSVSLSVKPIKMGDTSKPGLSKGQLTSWYKRNGFSGKFGELTRPPKGFLK